MREKIFELADKVRESENLNYEEKKLLFSISDALILDLISAAHKTNSNLGVITSQPAV